MGAGSGLSVVGMDTENLSEHFHHPRNVGEIEAPDAAGRATNPVCGDEVRLTLRLDGDRIVEIKYRAFGCHATIGTMSALSRRIVGMTVAEARALRAPEVIAWFEDFPRGKIHAADVSVSALRHALTGEAG